MPLVLECERFRAKGTAEDVACWCITHECHLLFVTVVRMDEKELVFTQVYR